MLPAMWAGPLACAVLLRAVSASPCQGEESCPASGDDDAASLAQLRVQQLTRVGSTVCFETILLANPVAVPDAVPPAVPFSSAYATIHVNPDAITTSISWTVPGVNATNKVIGLHIHQGDSHVNGGILVGFCGTDPLPPFSGPCEQGVNVVLYNVSGQACDITGSGSPCVDTSGAGTIGDASAILMANAADATEKYYLNLHTDQSFALSDDKALGLIRGQLREVSC